MALQQAATNSEF